MTALHMGQEGFLPDLQGAARRLSPKGHEAVVTR